MNTARYIKQIASSAFNGCGYTYKSTRGAICAFRKERTDGFSEVIFSRNGAKMILVTYFTSGIHEFPLKYDLFLPDFCPESVLGWGYDSNLEPFIDGVVKASVRTIFPYIDNMYLNCVEFLPEMSMDLAQDTRRRAADFIKKWGLSTRSGRKLLDDLQTIINSMNGDSSMRRAAFYQNYDEIVNMAACFGELLSRADGTPHQWEWSDRSGQNCYVISAQSYNPLARIIDAWNFGSEVLNYSLAGFPL